MEKPNKDNKKEVEMAGKKRKTSRRKKTPKKKKKRTIWDYYLGK